MKHCDEYIDDAAADPALRAFLEFKRRPAVEQKGSCPKLFATYRGRDPLALDCAGSRCRVVMASRFGDVGVRFWQQERDHGYSLRCDVADLSDFSAEA